jgi:hypothetical protein
MDRIFTGYAAISNIALSVKDESGKQRNKQSNKPMLM